MKSAMNESAPWIRRIALINALHLSEQMLFGIGELATLRRILAGYYARFQQPDYGTVVLVIAGSSLLFLLLFAAVAGGWRREIAEGFVGVVAVAEAHHLLETFHAAHYTPGTVTAVPYVAAGTMLLRALIRESRGASPTESEWSILNEVSARYGSSF